MSDWKAVEEQDFRDFLYIEEVNSNDGVSRRLAGIKTSQSVQDLKKAIAAELDNPAGWGNIAIAFANQELDNLGASLSSFAVQDGDTVFFTRSVTPAVNPPPYIHEITLSNVFFKNVDGKTLTLHGIPISWKVKELREKLEQEKAIDASEYRFLWGGKQLEDEKTLESYGVGKDPTIHMVMRLLGGVV